MGEDPAKTEYARIAGGAFWVGLFTSINALRGSYIVLADVLTNGRSGFEGDTVEYAYDMTLYSIVVSVVLWKVFAYCANKAAK